MAKRNEATRGRLSREAIIVSAVALADAEGLDAVTIRRLAQEHGVTPMAMYWHFNDKDSLLDGLAEHLIEAVQLPEPGDAPWDQELREILDAFLAAIRPHPALAGLAMRRILAAESGLLIAERVLGLLRRGGFAPAQAAEVGTFLICSIITLAVADAVPGPPPTGEEREQALRDKRARLESLPPGRYPNVIAAAPALVVCRDEDDYFSLNLDLLVGGLHGLRRG
ncbi:TetR/AcrR family transcriptional regulator C-terminal domain-containing protein [Amorphoplanes nipponensis]|uniref:TetR family transcriptional regulator n=1 Tax=Actinoplanes nipponensis TaxID=135950 RepID=A0A919JHY7_9ACTN|nr:TetR/AcrR family transcriptional regulator C-terminal domain-containing protein [Actinoplanes nipponensis]GIE49546.1 TetR family transcriptional regulator [Actinoplanes nipponensis]